MFKNLFDLSVKRSGMEIFGFYLFYSILGAFAAGLICGVIIAFLHPEAKTFEDGARLGGIYGPVCAILYGVIMSLAVISAKGIFNSFQAVLLTIIAVPLLYFGGASLGMIPVAFLTAFDNNNPTNHN